MKRFSEEQIIGLLREVEAGLPVKELCRRHGLSGVVNTQLIEQAATHYEKYHTQDDD